MKVCTKSLSLNIRFLNDICEYNHVLLLVSKHLYLSWLHAGKKKKNTLKINFCKREKAKNVIPKRTIPTKSVLQPRLNVRISLTTETHTQKPGFEHVASLLVAVKFPEVILLDTNA